MSKSQYFRGAIALVVYGLACLAAPVSVPAETVTTPVADTFIFSGVPDFNYGSQGFIRAMTNGDGSSSSPFSGRLPFLRFDTSSLLAGNHTVTAASLSLYHYQDSGSATTPLLFRLWGIPDGVGDEFFEDHSGDVITWNNSSHTTEFEASASGLDYTGLVDLGTETLNFNELGWLIFESPELRGYLNDDANGIATFILERVTVANVLNEFYPREAAENQRPRLSTTHTPVPELGTAGLVFLGSACFLAWGRRARRED